jgi:capsid protein
MAKNKKTTTGQEVLELGYDAIQSSPRRGSIRVSTKSEDRELHTAGRQSLSSQGRDLCRNFPLVGFAIRKHLQTMANCNFNCSLPGQAEYSELVKRWIAHWSQRSHCDVAGRHSLTELMTLVETHRVIDGDVGILKCRDGRLQIIEGDRIKNPPKDLRGNGYEWIHGVKVGNAGQAYRYAIHKRKEGGGFEFEREIPAEWMILCGYFNRIDQIRGVSLLAPAINKVRDLDESIEYALAKAKISQLLGFKTYRDPMNMDSEDSGQGLADAIKEKFGVGTIHFDLAEGEDAKMVESQTPSTQFQQFLEHVIRIAFASLDIPLEFLMPSISNYYSSRGAVDMYIESCRHKQRGLIETLNDITDWRLRMTIADGVLPPPPDRISIEDLLWYCDWEGARLPYWRLLEDSQASVTAVQCGLISAPYAARQYGRDFYENITEQDQARKAAKALDMTLIYDMPITAMGGIGPNSQSNNTSTAKNKP